jgi:hypothetical protein
METTVPMAKRVSPFLLAIIMITLALSLMSIYQGIHDYINDDATSGSFYLTMGVTTLAISTYLLFQTKKRVLKLGMEMPPLTTTLECQKCGFKNVRDFQRGDFVFKPLEEQCPKCNEKAMSIGSIFREVKEREKTRESRYS